MPERVYPVDLPDNLDLAVQVLGHRVRVAALLALVNDGPASATKLASRLGVSRQLIQHHMAELERLGVVAVDPPRSETEVRQRFFRVESDSLRVVVRGLDALRLD